MTYLFLSEALRNYGFGSVFVNAQSVEEAREKARKYAEFYIKERFYYWFFDSNNFVDEDFRQDYDEFMEKLEKDLSKEPQTQEVFFVEGSN